MRNKHDNRVDPTHSSGNNALQTYVYIILLLKDVYNYRLIGAWYYLTNVTERENKIYSSILYYY